MSSCNLQGCAVLVPEIVTRTIYNKIYCRNQHLPRGEFERIKSSSKILQSLGEGPGVISPWPACAQGRVRPACPPTFLSFPASLIKKQLQSRVADLSSSSRRAVSQRLWSTARPARKNHGSRPHRHCKVKARKNWNSAVVSK